MVGLYLSPISGVIWATAPWMDQIWKQYPWTLSLESVSCYASPAMCNRLMQPLQYKHSWLTLLSNFEGLNLPRGRSETIHRFWKTQMLLKHGSQVYIVAQTQTDKQFSRARLRNTGRIVSDARWGKSKQQVWTRQTSLFSVLSLHRLCDTCFLGEKQWEYLVRCHAESSLSISQFKPLFIGAFSALPW